MLSYFQHIHFRNRYICLTVGPTFVSLCHRSLPPGIRTKSVPEHRAHHFPRLHSLLELRLGGKSTVMPVHWLLLGFWGNFCNLRFITCDDQIQKIVAVMMVPLQKCQSWLHALCFVFRCQLLCSVHWRRYHRPHLTIGGSWNKSLHVQPLQRCYCENSGSPASSCVMRRRALSRTRSRFRQ